MEYDIVKTYNHMGFDEKQHKYVNLKTNEVYTSVTTVIKNYVEPFDTEYFSQYKAIERILGAEFSTLKNRVGFKNVVTAYKIDGDLKRLGEVTQEILTEWDNKTKAACEKGTRYHESKENYTKSLMYGSVDGVIYDIARSHDLLAHDNAIFSELFVYNDYWKIAGQVDLAIKKCNQLTVRDYKTNKKITTENKFKNLLYPVDHLQETEFNKYQLQLSFYAYLIELATLMEIKGLFIDHWDGTKEKSYECKYLRSEVENICKHYSIGRS